MSDMETTFNIGIKVEQPRSIWVKPVKVKARVFKNLFEVFKGIAERDYVGSVASTFTTFADIELVTEAGELGWKLICNALSDAMGKLIYESQRGLRKEDIILDEVDEKLCALLEAEEFFIDFDFFKMPDCCRLINEIVPVYRDFLSLFEFEEFEVNGIADRLPRYFTYSLYSEWAKNSNKYRVLLDKLNNPLNDAVKRQLQWQRYNAWLEKQVDENVFGSSFSLRQLYVPLRAYYIESMDMENRKRVVVDLEKYLDNWVRRGDKGDSLKVISGGPGIGKSSFLKVFAAKQAKNEGIKVLFIPVHLFAMKDDFESAMAKFIQNNEYLSCNPLEEERLLIILDGLDEMQMQGKVLVDAVNDFISEVRMKIEQRNDSNLHLQVLMSGREIVVQNSKSNFRREQQILNILPYYFKTKRFEAWIDEKNYLEEDQRNIWWKNYGILTEKGYSGLPEKLSRDELIEVTAQPLLNYLVALTFEESAVDFDRNTNINSIYEALLKDVYNRGYENRIYKHIEKLDYREFDRILQEISVSTWHGDSRKTTVSEIEKHCKDNEFDNILEKFIKNAKIGVISLLAAFYFRQSDHCFKGEEAFEFTHKSFGEYLTAKKIVQKLNQIARQRHSNNETGDRWKIDFCLQEWIRLFGPKEIDEDLLGFIGNELMLQFEKDKASINKLQDTLIELIDYELKNGLPMEKLNTTYKIQNRQAINCELALFLILGRVSRLTKVVSKIAWPNETSFGELVSRLVGQRTPSNVLILSSFNYIDISDSSLDFKDLYAVDFTESNLSNAKLVLANLQCAHLQNADLKGADLQCVHLQSADLKGADLKGADLKGVDLQGADLKGADLKSADLRCADLQDADLRSADLQDADLQSADLKGADLKGADLKGVDLQSADLKGSDLKGADLRYADLRSADLSGAIIANTKFDSATLINTIIDDEVIKRYNLKIIKE